MRLVLPFDLMNEDLAQLWLALALDSLQTVFKRSIFCTDSNTEGLEMCLKPKILT